MRSLESFWRNDSGATAIEYAVIATVISLGIITGASMVGSRLQTLFFAKVAGNLN